MPSCFDGEELTLIDAGFPGKEQIVLGAIAELGKHPSDLKRLVFTHGHPDHIGSAAGIVRATGARTYMHAADVALAETGGPFRPMVPSPGLVKLIEYKVFWRPDERMEPFRIDQHITDGESVPVAGGLRAIHVPGHCAGQVALMWGGGCLLAGGDVFMNILGLGDPIGFENEAELRSSQRKLAELTFETVASAMAMPSPKMQQRESGALLRGADAAERQTQDEPISKAIGIIVVGATAPYLRLTDNAPVAQPTATASFSPSPTRCR